MPRPMEGDAGEDDEVTRLDGETWATGFLSRQWRRDQDVLGVRVVVDTSTETRASVLRPDRGATLALARAAETGDDGA